ncbi:36955_t:CDS:2, partial [Racocetra persica]
IISELLEAPTSIGAEFDIMADSLTKEEVNEFRERVGRYLARSTSYHDQSEEKDYHNLMNGILSTLGLEYLVISNCESGDGRYDHALIPLADKPRNTAFIFEYKKAVNQEDKELDLAVQKGLDQIDEKRYDLRVKQQPQVKRIIKVGLAFFGKRAKAKYKIEERVSGDN